MSDHAPPPHDRRALLAGIGGLAAGAFLTAGRAEAGPLVPPGAPLPSGKTLTEVEPRTAVTLENCPGDAAAAHIISAGGSYYLVGNIVAGPDKVGVRITTSNVTLDLNGFSILGQGGPDGGSLGGISDDGPGNPLSTVVIRNGTIAETTGRGISLSSTELGCIEDVIVRNHRREGIRVGARSRIARATVNLNAFFSQTPFGIVVGDNSIISACVVASNTGTGISAGNGCLITDCLVRGNTADGIAGNDGMTISHCAVSGNSQAGINVGGNALIDSCSCSLNAGVGFIATFAADIKNCVSRANNSGGFSVAEGGNLVGCTAAFCTGGGLLAHGFTVGEGTVVAACTSTNNGGTGIQVSGSVATSSGCIISGCTLRGNGGNGITITSGCYVHGCSCSTNSFANISASGNDNRMERNNCIGGQQGIIVTGSGNVITSNTCSGNTNNWNITINNIYGPVINRVAPASGAMSGNGTVASTLDTTDPYANFSY